MTVTSAPIGSTGQSLDGFAVNANVPSAFRESVVITDPTDPLGAVAVTSTQPISFYGIPVWIQGTPNFSSTVNITSTVNVTNTVTISASTQIISSVPLIVSQSTTPWLVSTAPIALVGTSQVFGTVSTQIVSSIPLIVSQSTTPWSVSGQVSTFPTGQASTFVANAPNVNVTNVPAVTVNGTTMVNIVSSIALGFTPTGTSFVSISSSQPIIVAQSTNPWTINGQINASSFTAVASTFPLGTTSTQIVSSIPLIVAQSSSPWGVNGQINISSASAQFSTFPTGQTSTFISGQGITVSTASIPVTQGGLSAFLKIGVTTASVTIKATAGKLHDIWFTNTATSTRWLKFYNASSAAIGTTAPLLTFGMPGTTTGANAIAGWIASAMGIQFSTAIFVGATASSATSTDTSAPAATDIILNCGFI